ncbi:hypothetical protein [Leucobacter chromiireducens]|uniref:Htaa protein n=1 Tax=Leucobacter chromiireducens subsp. chromiireducens TaxID=660067 RepID=A0ABS1SMN4_9MICO|nr:hypothetical protein [Leucobacter chromiireducens]MBL3689430.1 hypothetical protein [Leucobacter chromiireducens subsp. chromiireducens]
MTAHHSPHAGAARRPRAGRKLAAALILPLLAVAPLALGVSPAQAASRVDVAPAPAADGPTTVTLSGSGFQYQPNAPGGVYVFFGAVADPATNAWAPSQGGRSGETFAYAGTDGARLLVAFQGGSSASEANGQIDANGNWSTQMTIPGSRFTASFGNPHEGAQGNGQEIDCLQVQCGIITIGAHGLVNANNESFTPVSFASADGQLQAGAAPITDFGSGSGDASAAAPSTNDAATRIDVPGAAEQNAESGADNTAETPAAAAPVAEPAAADQTLTWAIIGVLGAAVLALLTSVVLVTMKRRRARRAVTSAAVPVAGPDAGGAPLSEAGTVTGGASAAVRAEATL